MTVQATAGGLRAGGTTLVPTSATRFEEAGGEATLVFESAPLAGGRPAAVLDPPGEPGVRIEPVVPVMPSAAGLAAPSAPTGAMRRKRPTRSRWRQAGSS